MALYVSLLQDPDALRLVSLYAETEKDALSALLYNRPISAIKTLEAITTGGEFRFGRHANDSRGIVTHPLDTQWPDQNSTLYSTMVGPSPARTE